MGRARTRRTTKKRRRSRSSRKGGGEPVFRVAWPTVVAGEKDYPLVPVGAVQEAPEVSWENGAQALRLFLCWDPDAPAASWLHWLVANCGGDSVDSGMTVVPWAPPSPPPGTGTHRYIFAVLEQPAGAPLALRPPNSRGNFSPEEFFEAHGLRLLASVGIRVAPVAYRNRGMK